MSIPIPPALRAKLLGRFDTLIAEGESLLKSGTPVPPEHDYNELSQRHVVVREAYLKIDWPRFVEWRAKATTLLDAIVPPKNAHRETVKQFRPLKCETSSVQWGLSNLKGLRDDLAQGFFDDIALRVESELTADYLGQAENLLTEGTPGKYDYVPAAVLAGAVLEKSLRTLCERHDPPIPIENDRGERKTLNPLIEDLKRADVISEIKAKILRSWAGIRNAAAHGDFEKFDRADVEQMVKGIENFLAEILR